MAKIAKKNKKSKGLYGKSDKKYQEDYDSSDILYGVIAKGKNTNKVNET